MVARVKAKAAGEEAPAAPPRAAPDLEAAVAEINTKYGTGTLIPLSRQPAILRIPTGVTVLDVATGGGWPVGRISMVWGPRSSGKSTLCAHAILQAQRLCRHDAKPMGTQPGSSSLPLEASYTNKHGAAVAAEDAYVDEEVVNEDMTTTTKRRLKDGVTASKFQEPMRTLLVNQEGAIDASWVTDIGVDPELVFCLTTETAEQTIDIVDSLMRGGVVDLVVIDSIASMTPSKEAEDTTENWQQGLHARLINKALRVWVATLNSFKASPVRPTMLLINQVRTKIGVMYGSPDVKPGGVGQDFATSLEVKLAAGSVEKKTDLAPEEDGGHLLLARTNFKVTKNKTAASAGVGQYLTATVTSAEGRPGQILQVKQTLDLAKQYGLLAKDGAVWSLLAGQWTFKTLAEAAEWAAKNPAEFSRASAAIAAEVLRLRSRR